MKFFLLKHTPTVHNYIFVILHIVYILMYSKGTYFIGVAKEYNNVIMYIII